MSGPLAKLLNDERVVAAAQAFTRIRVRVPEGYLLVLGPYETTRPGLLVLDADGRNVTTIPLPGMGNGPIDAATIAKRLRAARKAPAVELARARLQGSQGCMAKVRRDVAGLPGVAGAVLGADGVLKMRGAPGSLPPETLVAIAKGHVVELKMEEPVRVTVRTKAPDELRDVAGAWYTQAGPVTETYVTNLLLDPGRLAAAANGEPDVEARDFSVENMPKGGRGCQVAMAPLKVPGVVAIFPDIFHDAQRVVGRRGEVSWPDVARSFEKAGCKATPK